MKKRNFFVFLFFFFVFFFVLKINNFIFQNNQICFFWNNETLSFEKDEMEFLAKDQEFFNQNKIKKISLDQSFDFAQIELKNKKIEIKNNNKLIWETPAEWKVEDFILADSTNKGETYLNLLVWKSGSYGPHQPIWIKENDLSIKNHLFIFKIKDLKIEPIWQSSALLAPNCEILITDINNDQENELIVLEGDYKNQKCEGQYVAVWKWHEWGFQNEWRSEKGNYQNLRIEFFNQKNYIVVN